MSKFANFAKNSDHRHVLGLSGGKDSAALAIYIKDRYPEIHEKIEYFFSDTGAELTEVYEFLDKLEAYLGKEIIRLSSNQDFEHWLKLHNEYIPSPQQRWCTRAMKIEPFEKNIFSFTFSSFNFSSAKKRFSSTRFRRLSLG